jgi:transcription elongation factor GreB
MSRGFVKEDDQEEIPIVPQRAFLPEGVPNFVTPYGMKQLLEEKQALIIEKENLSIANENEKRITINHLNARLQLLNNRIAEARIVNPDEQPQNEIRFGARITLKALATGKTLTFQIVGVDEADISGGKISFLSPLARALTNKKSGDKVSLKRENGEVLFEIIKITYK